MAMPTWGEAPTSRAPGWVYTDADIYREELERFFYRGHWCYVGLEAEIPKPGDFKRTVIGERSVILVRDDDGARATSSRTSAPTAACPSAASATATARSSSAPTTSGTTPSRATCRACRSAAASRQDGRSTAACRPTSSSANTA